VKNSKSSIQFNRLPEIHRDLSLIEGPYSNQLKEMKDEQLYSCDSKQILNSFITEQNLTITFIDFDELSKSGKYQCFLQVITSITLGFYGESSISYEEAQNDAAYRSLVFFKCILNNSTLKTADVT